MGCAPVIRKALGLQVQPFITTISPVDALKPLDQYDLDNTRINVGSDFAITLVRQGDISPLPEEILKRNERAKWVPAPDRDSRTFSSPPSSPSSPTKGKSKAGTSTKGSRTPKSYRSNDDAMSSTSRGTSTGTRQSRGTKVSHGSRHTGTTSVKPPSIKPSQSQTSSSHKRTR